MVKIALDLADHFHLNMAVTLCPVKSHIHNQIFEDVCRFPPVIRSFSTMKNKHPSTPSCEKSAERWQVQFTEERQY